MARALFSQQRRPELSIELDRGNDSSKHLYTTKDCVAGKVLLHFHKDSTIDSFGIAFRGQCTSVVISLQPWARELPSVKTLHTFLMMQQPIEQQDLPSDHLAKAGSSHYVPFSFTIPTQLLPDACNHGLDEECSLSKAHRLLPPSLGAPISRDPGKGLVSESASVEYNVYAYLKTKSLRDDFTQVIEKEMPILVGPIFEPDPPLAIREADPDYQLCGAADLSLGGLRLGLNDGCLVLHTTQPLPLQVSRVTDCGSSLRSVLISTPIYVATSLEFSPKQFLGHPPQLKSVKIGLRAFTYSAAVPFSERPRPSYRSKPTHLYNVCSKFIDLGTHVVGDLVWAKCSEDRQSTELEGRLGCGSDPSVSIEQMTRWPLSTARAAKDVSHTCDLSAGAMRPSQDTDTTQNISLRAPMYTTSLQIPISLPTNEMEQKRLMLVPTFDSCIVGRNYVLELTYSFRSSCSAPCLTSSSTSNDRIGLRNTDNPSNVVVSANTSRPQVLSKTKKMTLSLPIQITSDIGPIWPNVDSNLSQQGTSTVHTSSAGRDVEQLSNPAKFAQTYHQEDISNSSPPSYYSVF